VVAGDAEALDEEVDLFGVADCAVDLGDVSLGNGKGVEDWYVPRPRSSGLFGSQKYQLRRRRSG